MFWLVCLWVVCLPVPTTRQAHSSFSTLVFTRHLVENINWRRSIPRLWGLEEGSSSETWLSSQEVLFLTTLHKHWKRDLKKCPRLTISTVNTQSYTCNPAPSPVLSYVCFLYVCVCIYVQREMCQCVQIEHNQQGSRHWKPLFNQYFFYLEL